MISQLDNDDNNLYSAPSLTKHLVSIISFQPLAFLHGGLCFKNFCFQKRPWCPFTTGPPTLWKSCHNPTSIHPASAAVRLPFAEMEAGRAPSPAQFPVLTQLSTSISFLSYFLADPSLEPQIFFLPPSLPSLLHPSPCPLSLFSLSLPPCVSACLPPPI